MARAAVLTDARIRDLAVKPKRYSVHDALVPGLLVRVYPSARRSLMLTAVYPGHPDATRRHGAAR